MKVSMRRKLWAVSLTLSVGVFALPFALVSFIARVAFEGLRAGWVLCGAFGDYVDSEMEDAF